MVDCSICFEEGKEIIHLPCFHNMCNTCYIRLYDNTDLPKCPFCKHPMHISTQEDLDLYNADMERPRQNNNELASILRQLANVYRYAIENDNFNIVWNFDNNALGNENNIIVNENNIIVNAIENDDIVNAIENDEIENENDENAIENEIENDDNDIANEIENDDNEPGLVNLDDEQILEMVATINYLSNIQNR